MLPIAVGSAQQNTPRAASGYPVSLARLFFPRDPASKQRHGVAMSTLTPRTASEDSISPPRRPASPRPPERSASHAPQCAASGSPRPAPWASHRRALEASRASTPERTARRTAPNRAGDVRHGIPHQTPQDAAKQLLKCHV